MMASFGNFETLGEIRRRRKIGDAQFRDAKFGTSQNRRFLSTATTFIVSERRGENLPEKTICLSRLQLILKYDHFKMLSLSCVKVKVADISEERSDCTFCAIWS